MPERTPPPPVSPDTGVSAGLLVASAMVPETFARSLSARSAVDQGIVTGLAAGLHYLLTVGTQDALQAVAAELVANTPARRGADLGTRQLRLTLLADLAAIPLGLAVQRALPPRPGEPMLRGALRQSGWRVAVTGLGGTLLLATQAGARAADARLGAGGPDRVLPGGGAGRPRRRLRPGPAPRGRPRGGSGRARRRSVEPALARGRRRGGGRPGRARVRRARPGDARRPGAGVRAARRRAAVEAGRARRHPRACSAAAPSRCTAGRCARSRRAPRPRCRCSRRTRRPGGPGRR